MHIHVIALPSRYLQVSHDIVRHPRLNGTAKALLQWALSLPPGTRETLQTIGQKMPEGRIAVSKARRQLIDEGYVHIRREQSRETGMWTTEILVSHVVLCDPQEIAAAWAAAGSGRDGGGPDGGGGGGGGGTGPGGVRPDDGKLTVGELEPQAVGTSPKGAKTRVNTSLPAARTARSARGGAAPAEGGVEGDVADEAADDVGCDLGSDTGGGAAALFRAVAVEPRLRLGVREALALAPLAEEWLARGATERELRIAVVEGLPGRIHSPAALLRSRLERKLPPPPADLLPPPPRPRTHACGRCEAPGLSAPGICRTCAGLRPAASEASMASDAVAAALRGAAAVRAAVGWTTAAPATT